MHGRVGNLRITFFLAFTKNVHNTLTHLHTHTHTLGTNDDANAVVRQEVGKDKIVIYFKRVGGGKVSICFLHVHIHASLRPFE